MKRILPVVCLIISGATSLHAQIATVGTTRAATSPGASRWSAQVSPRAGDTLLVGCDYAAGLPFVGVSDSSGDSFAQIGPEENSAFAARTYIAVNVKGGSTTVTCTAASAASTNEIYVTEFTGVNPATPIDNFSAASGTSGSAKAVLATSHANEVVWAYVVTGHASDPSGWTKLSSFDGNLVADRSVPAPTIVNPSFPVTMSWTLFLVALEPIGSSSGGSAPISVSVTPSSASVQSSQSLAFTASLQDDSQNKGVTWSLAGSSCSGATCGTLSNATATSVTYTAPAAVPSPPAVALTATSVADTTKSASASITITAATQPISVSINPSSVSVQTSQSSNFSAVLQNDSRNEGVSWSLSGSGCSGSACGTLTDVTSTSITYNAPPNVPAPAAVRLVATSVADQTRNAGATITITSAPPTGTGGRPTLVQFTSDASTGSNGSAAYTLRLPNGTQAGNCVIVGFQFATGYGISAVSVTDDKNDSYKLAVANPGNQDGSQVVNAAYATNVAAGARVITVTFSGGSPNWTSATAYEYYNVAIANTFDGSSANSGSGLSISAGDIATTANGDLVWQYAVQDSSIAATEWAAGTGSWTMRTADGFSQQAVQDQVQGSAAMINPTMSISSSSHWNTVAIALKSASAGSGPPAGIRVSGVSHFGIPESLASNPLVVQFPCTGNLIVPVWLGIGGYDISDIIDSSGNVYNPVGPPASYGSSGDGQIFHADSASCSATLELRVSTTGNNSSGGSVLVLYEVTGAAASPYDTSAAATGNQTSSGMLATVSLTPSSANSVAIAMLTVESNTVTDVSPGLFDSGTTVPAIAISPVDQNNGLAHYNCTDTSEISFQWTVSGPPANWASVAAVFHAP